MLDATDLRGTNGETDPTRHFQLGQRESLNLCEILSSSREGIMNKRSRKRLFWSFKRSEMQFLMKPSSLESACRRNK